MFIEINVLQGDQNKVILLSLVRSNCYNNVGFFSETDRICVAISRAQCALYIFGDPIHYSDASTKWKVQVFLVKVRIVKVTKPPNLT